jgi:hypothetical protein
MAPYSRSTEFETHPCNWLLLADGFRQFLQKTVGIFLKVILPPVPPPTFTVILPPDAKCPMQMRKYETKFNHISIHV